MATALLRGRDYVIPDDVLYCLDDVVLHRIILNSKAKINGLTGSQILRSITQSIQVPRISK